MSETLKMSQQADPRIENSERLLEDFELNQDAEFFTNPVNRIEFLKSLEFEDFFDIAEHVNDRVRGYDPRQRVTHGEPGGALPMLKTPAGFEEKQLALGKGFEIIKNFLQSAPENENSLRAAGMATEALIVWVHPFADGNGRTSRFLGKFIEDGTTDTTALVQETADKNNRMRWYGENTRVDDVTDLNNPGILLEDDEREEIHKRQAELPITDGIAYSVQRLLQDESLQEKVLAEAQRNLDTRQKALDRKAA